MFWVTLKYFKHLTDLEQYIYFQSILGNSTKPTHSVSQVCIHLVAPVSVCLALPSKYYVTTAMSAVMKASGAVHVSEGDIY